ncbi:MAG: hypothetical protein AAF512_04440, partial [Pseudomonadota bacterium]
MTSEHLRIDEIGWKGFLQYWNDKASLLVKKIGLKNGIFPASSEDRIQEMIQHYKEHYNFELPNEAFRCELN